MHSERRSLRLRGYDYCNPDPYYFTACTKNRECLFGEIHDEKMHLNIIGEIVWDCWRKLPRHIGNVLLDSFIVTPNHMHGIFWIVKRGRDSNANARPRLFSDGVMRPVVVPSVGMTHASSLQDRIVYSQTPFLNALPARGPLPGSVGAIIGSLKSAATRLINRSRNTPGSPVWQYNFHERIIRTQSSLERIRRYIDANPRNWHRDRLRPGSKKTLIYNNPT
jgi:REP element-mobilizing transposase RayT